MAFTELIKNFDKIRYYMRDFYIYGFKSRSDFNVKSSRTYDNEKRRIESYLSPYVRWESDKKGKRIFISLDTAGIGSNPLYNAWKAKSFTDNDITLHFAILSALREGHKTISELTDAVCSITDMVFEAQTVRLKANEYVREGLLVKTVQKKTDYYEISSVTVFSLPVDREKLLDAIRFFQEAAPFGFIGSTVLDQENERENRLFGFKHHYIVHTLEDGVLMELLHAMHDKRRVVITTQSSRFSKENIQAGVPVQIFVSVQSGRRYACIYTEKSRRFHNYRLDYIKKADVLDEYPDYDELSDKLDKLRPYCWGVSFGMSQRPQTLSMKLCIDEEKERYVLERLRREGRGGDIQRIEQNTYQYTVTLFDITEMMAWVKSFTGRILSLEGSSKKVVDYFYRDMERMAALYGGDA